MQLVLSAVVFINACNMAMPSCGSLHLTLQLKELCFSKLPTTSLQTRPGLPNLVELTWSGGLALLLHCDPVPLPTLAACKLTVATELFARASILTKL